MSEGVSGSGAVEDVVKEIARMINAFVRCRMYSFADRLANAASKEVVEAALYEALRVARSAQDAGRPLCEDGQRRVMPYVASEESVKFVLDLLDKDLVGGLELVRKIAIRAVAFPGRKESE